MHSLIRVTNYKLTNQTIIEISEVVPNMNRNTIKKIDVKYLINSEPEVLNNRCDMPSDAEAFLTFF